jgi:hypothetical protein
MNSPHQAATFSLDAQRTFKAAGENLGTTVVDEQAISIKQHTKQQNL